MRFWMMKDAADNGDDLDNTDPANPDPDNADPDNDLDPAGDPADPTDPDNPGDPDKDIVSVSKAEFNRAKMFERLFLKSQEKSLETEPEKPKPVDHEKDFMAQVKAAVPDYDDDSLKAMVKIAKIVAKSVTDPVEGTVKQTLIQTKLDSFAAEKKIAVEDKQKISALLKKDPAAADLIEQGKLSFNDLYSLMDYPRLQKQLNDLKVQSTNGSKKKAGFAGAGGKGGSTGGTKQPTAEEMKNWSYDQFKAYRESKGIKLD